MRLVVLLLIVGCSRSEAPPPPPAAAPRLELPRADAGAAVPLGKANPVAVVLVGPRGELSVGAWDGKLPTATQPMADVAAVEAAIVERARKGGEMEQLAALKWTDPRELREWRDETGELEQEQHFSIARKYFGHFPSGLDPKRKEENELPRWGQVGRLAIARADIADRVPPLAPLIASAPGAPALPTVHIAQKIGGAIGVSLDGKPGVLRAGFRWAIDIDHGYYGAEMWVEVRAAASGLEIIDRRGAQVRAVTWDNLGSLVAALGTPAPELVDVLVAPDLTAQQLVDTLSALHGVRWVNLAVAPAGTGAERLAQVLATRLARRMEDRVKVESMSVDPSTGEEEDAIKKVLDAGRPALAACYDARRAQMGDPEEFVGVQFDLGPGSKVSKLRVNVGDAQLATCMRDVIARLTFTPVKARQKADGVLRLTAPDRHD